MIMKQVIRFGEKLPDRIVNAPELRPWLQLYFKAFFDLDSERNHGMGYCKIPFTSVLTYAQFYEFDAEQTDDLIFFIRRMDDAHLDRLNKKANAKGK